MSKIIQIVEDDQDIRFILEYILADTGYVLEIFDCITAFSNRHRKDNINLIILDVQLPDGNGIDLCNHLKTSELTKHIPVVIMSANASRNDAIAAGKADDFIAKPFDLEKFLARIHEILNY